MRLCVYRASIRSLSTRVNHSRGGRHRGKNDNEDTPAEDWSARVYTCTRLRCRSSCKTCECSGVLRVTGRHCNLRVKDTEAPYIIVTIFSHDKDATLLRNLLNDASYILAFQKSARARQLLLVSFPFVYYTALPWTVRSAPLRGNTRARVFRLNELIVSTLLRRSSLLIVTIRDSRVKTRHLRRARCASDKHPDGIGKFSERGNAISAAAIRH